MHIDEQYKREKELPQIHTHFVSSPSGLMIGIPAEDQLKNSLFRPGE
jgi:hypothetical protein